MEYIEEIQNKISIVNKELSDIIEELNIANLEVEAINLQKEALERKQDLINKEYRIKQTELSQLYDEFNDLMVKGIDKNNQYKNVNKEV